MWSVLEPSDLTPTIPGQSTKLLCRLIPYENEPIGIKRYEELEMPIYNEHFFIDLAIVPSAQVGARNARTSVQTLRNSSPTLRDLQDANLRTGHAISDRNNAPGDLLQRNTSTPRGFGGDSRMVINSGNGNSRFTQAQVESAQSQRTEDKLSNLMMGAVFMEGNGVKSENIQTESARNGVESTAEPAGGSTQNASVTPGFFGY